MDMNTCNGICARDYETKKLVRGVHKTDYKRCSKCCLFLKYAGIHCPCCGVRLKVSPRNSTARKMNREMREVVRY